MPVRPSHLSIIARLAVYVFALVIVASARVPETPRRGDGERGSGKPLGQRHECSVAPRHRWRPAHRYRARGPSPEARMALKSTAPLDGGLKARFNWVTQAGASTLKNLPFGAAVGVVVSGIVLWLAPQLVPDGWSAEAVISLGMGSRHRAASPVRGIAGLVHRADAASPRFALGSMDPARQGRRLPQARASAG